MGGHDVALDHEGTALLVSHISKASHAGPSEGSVDIHCAGVLDCAVRIATRRTRKTCAPITASSLRERRFSSSVGTG